MNYTVNTSPAAVDSANRTRVGTNNVQCESQEFPVNKVNVDSMKECDNMGGIFYFESDHLAFKGNDDYQLLLKTIAILEAQRMQAISDHDKLIESKERALRDMTMFVEELAAGKDLDLPKPQAVRELPVIDWSKYTSDGDSAKDVRRQRRKNATQPLVKPEDSKCTILNNGTSSQLVRGRVMADDKPATFNQLWTEEEQRRLEELLIEFPPEEVESRRWQKISVALGSRTPNQVQSRVQKYFIKLAKAGLPIPGRVPHSNMLVKKHSTTHRSSRAWYQPSTFLASYVPPVYMNDLDPPRDCHSPVSSVTSGSGPLCVNVDSSDGDVSSEEDIDEDLKDTEEYRELMQLKQIRKQKLKEEKLAQHLGFKCDGCQAEPITGTRWHCDDCPENFSTDFCESCASRNIETDFHKKGHSLRAVSNPTVSSGIDPEYMDFSYATHNYLDPNYMPFT